MQKDQAARNDPKEDKTAKPGTSPAYQLYREKESFTHTKSG